jgi:type IV secretory pathway VirB6-like protein
MFSTTAGIMMFITGAMAVLNIFFFAIRVIFCYLTSYLIICFLIILSPLIIPLALFYWTERYFTKWLHIMISAMLTPMILFAFLSMLLKIFGQLIGELFCPLGFKLTDLMLVNPDPDICKPELGVVVVDAAHPVDFRAFFRMNQPLVSWLMPHDAGADTELQTVTNTTDVGTPAVQSNINPMARRAMDAGSAGVPGVDFGPGTIQTVQSLVLSFIKLWIFGTIMTTMVKKIPAIASDMAGVNSVSSIGPTKLESESMRAMNNFKNRFSAGLKDKNEFYQIAKKEIRPY